MNVTAEELLKRFEPKPTTVLNPDRQLAIVRCSPCGKYLLAGGFDGLVRRWNLTQDPPAELPPVKGHHGWVEGLVFHPAQPIAFTADSWGQLRAWNYADESPAVLWVHEQAHDGWIHDLAIDPAGNHLATAGNDARVRLWSAPDGALRYELKHDDDVHCVALHPRDAACVSGDLFGRLRHWNLADGSLVRELDGSKFHLLSRLQDIGGLRRMAFDPDGKSLWCAGTIPSIGATMQGVPTLLRFDWESGKQHNSFALGEARDCLVHDFAFHPSGFVVAVTSGLPGSGKVVLLAAHLEKPFFETTRLQNCHSVALLADGRRMVVAATNSGSNGNGRPLRNGEYVGNFSPLHFLQFAETQSS
jgi:WD40 repeat protein